MVSVAECVGALFCGKVDDSELNEQAELVGALKLINYHVRGVGKDSDWVSDDAPHDF